MTDSNNLSGFSRRMQHIGRLFELSLKVMTWGINTFFVFMVLMIGLIVLFDAPQMPVIIMIGLGIGCLLVAAGLTGIFVSMIFAMFETGASGIDWLFKYNKSGKQKSERKLKLDGTE